MQWKWNWWLLLPAGTMLPGYCSCCWDAPQHWLHDNIVLVQLQQLSFHRLWSRQWLCCCSSSEWLAWLLDNWAVAAKKHIDSSSGCLPWLSKTPLPLLFGGWLSLSNKSLNKQVLWRGRALLSSWSPIALQNGTQCILFKSTVQLTSCDMTKVTSHSNWFLPCI